MSINYRIIGKDPFELVGFKKGVPILFNGVNPEIVKMYELLTPEIIKRLKSFSNVEPTGMCGGGYIRSGSLLPDMRQLKVPKFYGMKVRI